MKVMVLSIPSDRDSPWPSEGGNGNALNQVPDGLTWPQRSSRCLHALQQLLWLSFSTDCHRSHTSVLFLKLLNSFHAVIDWIVFPKNIYGEFLILGASECDCIWRSEPLKRSLNLSKAMRWASNRVQNSGCPKIYEKPPLTWFRGWRSRGQSLRVTLHYYGTWLAA